MSYAAREKYDAPGRAARYAARSRRRDAAEWRLLERLIDRLPEAPRSALDLPCGTGRIAARLLDRGIPTRAADLSPAMREEARARLAGRPGFLGIEAADLDRPEALAVAPADLVVCFRFFPHLPDADARARVLESLRRVTRRWLLLSFHHPVSAHALARGIRRWLTGRRAERRAIWPSDLGRMAEAHGLRLARLAALGRWRRDLWVALLEPAPAP
jgi:SAM-dependent methyltransferase